MRTEKLGSRTLRVVTPDGKVRYFISAPGLASLRLFWIFRNFGTIKDSVLSVKQRALIRQIYRTGEVHKAAVDLTKVLGTLEVSRLSNTLEWKAPASRVIQLAVVPPSSTDRQTSGRLLRLVLNSSGVVGIFLFILTLLGNRDARRQPMEHAPNPAFVVEAQLPDPAKSREIRQATSASAAPDERPQDDVLKSPPAIIDKASVLDAELAPTGNVASSSSPDQDVVISSISSVRTAGLQRASSTVASPSVTDPIQSSDSSAHFSAPSREGLPPSGPPQTHPVLADFSPVARDTEVILRAIVSEDGSVTKVKVLAGSAQLAREAARAVASWHYSPRPSRGDAASLIVFRFLAPDTVSVSFLDSAAADARR